MRPRHVIFGLMAAFALASAGKMLAEGAWSIGHVRGLVVFPVLVVGLVADRLLRRRRTFAILVLDATAVLLFLLGLNYARLVGKWELAGVEGLITVVLAGATCAASLLLWRSRPAPDPDAGDWWRVSPLVELPLWLIGVRGTWRDTWRRLAVVIGLAAAAIGLGISEPRVVRAVERQIERITAPSDDADASTTGAPTESEAGGVDDGPQDTVDAGPAPRTLPRPEDRVDPPPPPPGPAPPSRATRPATERVSTTRVPADRVDGRVHGRGEIGIRRSTPRHGGRPPVAGPNGLDSANLPSGLGPAELEAMIEAGGLDGVTVPGELTGSLDALVAGQGAGRSVLSNDTALVATLRRTRPADFGPPALLASVGFDADAIAAAVRTHAVALASAWTSPALGDAMLARSPRPLVPSALPPSDPLTGAPPDARWPTALPPAPDLLPTPPAYAGTGDVAEEADTTMALVSAAERDALERLAAAATATAAASAAAPSSDAAPSTDAVTDDESAPASGADTAIAEASPASASPAAAPNVASPNTAAPVASDPAALAQQVLESMQDDPAALDGARALADTLDELDVDAAALVQRLEDGDVVGLASELLTDGDAREAFAELAENEAFMEQARELAAVHAPELLDADGELIVDPSDGWIAMGPRAAYALAKADGGPVVGTIRRLVGYGVVFLGLFIVARALSRTRGSKSA